MLQKFVTTSSHVLTRAADFNDEFNH